ncbi:MAG: hypothetical protein KDA88_09355 [Planctomycetaceae bacterium]|nr:hypothetical protein [Planctomycetaceae bacterium]MCB9951967.1 hypothetical protein [Planctomycetaceae bacterium]
MPTTLAAFQDQIFRVVRALRFPAETQETRRPALSRARKLTTEETQGRFAQLHESCEWLLPGFDELDALMVRYIRETPIRNESSLGDAERFLEWLAMRVDLTEQQMDTVVCQQSRYTVEFVAVKKKLAHARFQELLSNNRRLAKELGHNRKLTIHLNPVHVWTTLETRVYLDEYSTIPATVLFYPVNAGVEGAVVEEDVVPLLKQLSRRPCKFDDLVGTMPHYDRDDLIDIVAELVQLGVVALA